MRLLIALVIAACIASIAGAADPFQENVRPTDAISAGDEAKSFHLPPGFEIQLVATEPQIGKPFNVAFDARGRLWVTCSRAYPFPAKDGHDAMDRILILDDFDDNGHARKITTFAESLNIPIGVYPYKDGCIAYSIPNVSYYADTDGDGKADKVETLVGPFSYDRDTHGMASNFRRGFDGWLYGCHGFNNVTHAKAKDGSELNLNSGNTYRFRVDGSHAEQFTWGQTNPFGLAFDPLGNLYSSDSHSKPFYQLIRGGYYEGIGKQDDGLGLAPMMMQHFHNSTAIASTFIYLDEQWPAQFRNNCFCGNVVTSRINRDSITYKGTTPVAHEEPDFLTTDDPWFRPVQLYLGPDGAMWVADFYNKIIGHYEVPLTHPARDHDHGRIWRIVYKGDKPKAPAPWRGDLTKASAAELIETLKSPNLTLRMLATDQLTDRIGIAGSAGAINALGDKATSGQAVHLLWTAFRSGDYAYTLASASVAARSNDPTLRVHAMRVLSEIPQWSLTDLADPSALSLAGLRDGDSLVQRAATDAIGRHANPEYVKPLLELFQRVAPEDTHLRYTVKVALRETLKSPGIFAKLPQLDPSDARVVADVAAAVPTEESGRFVAAFLSNPANNAAGAAHLLRHAMRYAPAGESEKLASVARAQFKDDLDLQLALLKGIRDAAAQRGVAPSEETMAWAAELAPKLLTTPSKDAKQTAQRQQAGADIARALKDAKLAPALRHVIEDGKADPAARAAAARALGAVDPVNGAPALLAIAADAGAPIALRESCVDGAAEQKDAAARTALLEALQQAPARLQTRMALAFAADADGAERLLTAVREGKASPRLLQEPAVRERLKNVNLTDLDKRIATLTHGFPALDAQVQSLIDARRAAYAKSKPNLAAGQKVFEQNCVACHAIDGKGGMVGPQLDGIGNRGLDRLLEDVLDPNRAVDPAFHAWNVRLKDGSDLSGILRREEGQTLVLADPTGKEIAIPKAQIVERKESNLSLMPTNFGEVIPTNDFHSMMGYLLSKNAVKK